MTDAIAKQFTDYYYQQFDSSDRKTGLAPLYVSNLSFCKGLNQRHCVTTEGYLYDDLGAAAIHGDGKHC